MVSHWHDPRAGTQNQGNHIGDRSCVRQSKLYRRYESGNQVKDLLGQGSLKWNENKKQGAYAGQKVYDHSTADHGVSLRGDGRASGNRPAFQPSSEPPFSHGYGAALEQQIGVAGPLVDARAAQAHAAMGGQGWTQAPPARAAPPAAEPQPGQGIARKGSRRTMEVEVQFRDGDHQFGKTTAPSVLSTRPW